MVQNSYLVDHTENIHAPWPGEGIVSEEPPFPLQDPLEIPIKFKFWSSRAPISRQEIPISSVKQSMYIF